MTTERPLLDRATEARIRDIFEEFVPKWKAAWAGYPKNCCGQSTRDMITRLESEFPGVFRQIVGTYAGHGHTWIASRTGVIIDPTLGQFARGPATRIVRPNNPLYANFKGTETFS